MPAQVQPGAHQTQAEVADGQTGFSHELVLQVALFKGVLRSLGHLPITPSH